MATRVPAVYTAVAFDPSSSPLDPREKSPANFITTGYEILHCSECLIKATEGHAVQCPVCDSAIYMSIYNISMTIPLSIYICMYGIYDPEN
jgi:hypothetical protein